MAGPDIQRFLEQFRRIVVPSFRRDGFKGSGKVFRRLSGEAIHVLQLQGSSTGEYCYLNVGIHLSFLPGGDEPKRLTEPACEFRIRVTPPNEYGFSWPYGKSVADAEKVASRMNVAYCTAVKKHFEDFGVYPDSFNRVTPEQLDMRDHGLVSGSLTNVRAKLAYARIALHQGRLDQARSFARLGLEDQGRHALRPLFRRILSQCDHDQEKIE